MGRTLVGLHTKDYIWAILQLSFERRLIMTTVLLLSDIHGNLPALEKTLEDASQRADITSVWVMGDSVGYGAQPNEVVERLRLLPDLAMVKGNHEAAAIGEISIANFNPSAAASAAWTARCSDCGNSRFPNLAAIGNSSVKHHALPRHAAQSDLGIHVHFTDGRP